MKERQWLRIIVDLTISSAVLLPGHASHASSNVARPMNLCSHHASREFQKDHDNVTQENFRHSDSHPDASFDMCLERKNIRGLDNGNCDGPTNQKSDSFGECRASRIQARGNVG
jgi:hypothetical protein